MGYSIHLVDPVTKETLKFPHGHVMCGSTYKADYHSETGTFTPALNDEAELSVTYNYSSYYYLYDKDNGLRCIKDKSGAECIPIFKGMIDTIESEYKDENGEWLTTEREKLVYYDENGRELDDSDVLCNLMCNNTMYHRKEKIKYKVNEDDTSDYWESTAANALRPLYQLLAFAQLRPDGVFEID